MSTPTHPLAHKIAVARTFLTQAGRIYMSMCDRDAEKRHVTQALNSKGYPTGAVKRNWEPRRHTALHPIQ